MNLARANSILLNLRRFKSFKMDRLRQQDAEVKDLTNQLNQMISKVTKNANPAIQKNIQHLESEKIKLLYQVINLYIYKEQGCKRDGLCVGCSSPFCVGFRKR